MIARASFSEETVISAPEKLSCSVREDLHMVLDLGEYMLVPEDMDWDPEDMDWAPEILVVGPLEPDRFN
jgi:hypothetical protein